MIYITGDTQGRFERIENFCKMNSTSKDDIMIILGDAGINFSGPMYDSLKKKLLEEYDDFSYASCSAYFSSVSCVLASSKMLNWIS